MSARPVVRLAAQTRPAPCNLPRFSRAAATPLLRPYPLELPTNSLVRPASSSSSTRWQTRQSRDPYTVSSKLSALKSRAAYKLLEINEKHRLFRPGQTVVDLGYAPGSWSQVAKNRVGGSGRVVGIDVIPAQPPRGVSTLQGDFLSVNVQERLREFVRDARAGVHPSRWVGREEEEDDGEDGEEGLGVQEEGGVLERAASGSAEKPMAAGKDVRIQDAAGEGAERVGSVRAQDAVKGRVVDVVLSDMCAPWPLERSSWINSVNNPYRRMMNTSGNPFRDHAGSMDLSMAALTFCHDTLVTGGHFLCKFYQGAEDKSFETRLKKLFEKVYRIKPDSSRKESREAYFVGLRRKTNPSKEDVLGEM